MNPSSATTKAVGACVGSEGEGVEAGSARGQVCDIPAVGPWPYTLLVGTVSMLFALTCLVRYRPRGVLAWVTALLPAVLVFIVPTALSLLPR